MTRSTGSALALWSALALVMLGGCATTKLRREVRSCKEARIACQRELDNSRAQRVAAAAKLDACADAMRRERHAHQQADQLARRYRALAAKLREAAKNNDIRTRMRRDRLVVQLPNRVLFDFGRAELKAEGGKTLDRIAVVLQSIGDRDFLIAGHTDNVPVKKRNRAYRSNWELSTLRALAVLHALLKAGVTAKHLAVAGYGQYQPDASNDSAEGRALNRRTELIIMPRMSEIPTLENGNGKRRRGEQSAARGK